MDGGAGAVRAASPLGPSHAAVPAPAPAPLAAVGRPSTVSRREGGRARGLGGAIVNLGGAVTIAAAAAAAAARRFLPRSSVGVSIRFLQRFLEEHPRIAAERMTSGEVYTELVRPRY
jgi:hypothetical protein